MSMEESEKMDLEVNGLSLIDFSSENDNLIGNSSSPLPSWGLEEYPSSVATNVQEEMDMACKDNHDDQFPQLHESKEPERARRKERSAIPAASGEVSAKTDNGANSSDNEVDLASKDRMKPKLAPKRIIGAQAGTPKSQPKQITGTQRLGKGLNQDKAQVTQSISRTTSGASLKPPKISTKLQPVSASKRASLDITRVKTDNDSMKISTASVRGSDTKASACK
ncbi:hypothetical protein HAX54_051614 [Datura stramonium]|uniref:Uncharacterized protein n=1 Tax=Datura stramonium TaxID=4076 RepID=A0ABS8WSI5_DATST|nr:hypothetical protein [Datura stramonium]